MCQEQNFQFKNRTMNRKDWRLETQLPREEEIVSLLRSRRQIQKVKGKAEIQRCPHFLKIKISKEEEDGRVRKTSWSGGNLEHLRTAPQLPEYPGACLPLRKVLSLGSERKSTLGRKKHLKGRHKRKF